MPQVEEATTDEIILACWPAINALRPHIKREKLVSIIRQQQEGGYRLLCVRDPQHQSPPNGEVKVTAILGFRTNQTLFRGKHLYVDDFSTLPEARGQGNGSALMDWVINFAKANDFDTVSLDGGNDSHAAHRLYLNKGFILRSHHFDLVNVNGKNWA